MKAESLKHLQKMHSMCSEDMGYFKELIEAIIRIESEPKTKSKFKIWDYVSKDDIRPSMCCVFHDSGYKVASDAHILVALKEDYPEAMEGKMMNKDGTFLKSEIYYYPKWRSVIPDKKNLVPVKLDFEKIRGFEQIFKARLKASGWSSKTDGFVKVSKDCWFKLDYLIKIMRFMELVGTDILMIDPNGRRAALAEGGESKAILMPIINPSDDKLERTLIL